MTKHIHILGICGTFMGSLAVLARELGFKVTGSDLNVYPPMSTYLKSQGIEIIQGFHAEQLEPLPDVIVVGNAMKRTQPVIEALLNRQLPFMSGPEFLAHYILKDKWVLAVTGTHGKTTTTSLLAFILEHAGLAPGFLIGGLPKNFGVSSRLGRGQFFVVEGDEYDTAFFDKRSKFVHYHPKTVIINNLEFDHADIFENVAAIQKQFHHLLKIIPSEGRIIFNHNEPRIQEVLAMGCWAPTLSFGNHGDYEAKLIKADGSQFEIIRQGKVIAEATWSMLGEHNVSNALAAIAAAEQVGVTVAQSVAALREFSGIKRRLELRGEVNGIKVYDDFAHHPTAIFQTLKALRQAVGKARIFAVIEPRSNSMRMGQFRDELAPSLKLADEVLVYEPPKLNWNIADALQSSQVPFKVSATTDEIIAQLKQSAKAGEHILIMSNGGFENIHERLLHALA